MRRLRNSLREKRRRRRQYWRKPSRFSMKRGGFGGKTRSKAARSDDAATVFVTRKRVGSADTSKTGGTSIPPVMACFEKNDWGAAPNPVQETFLQKVS